MAQCAGGGSCVGYVWCFYFKDRPLESVTRSRVLSGGIFGDWFVALLCFCVVLCCVVLCCVVLCCVVLCCVVLCCVALRCVVYCDEVWRGVAWRVVLLSFFF